ncbi:hypothetical protein Tco_1347528, partial [Tanacetum coccineum]
FSGTGLLFTGHIDLTGDEDPTDEDEDNDMGDLTEGSVSLGIKVRENRMVREPW